MTENDAFRSNQIRAGILARSEALRIVEAENQPRREAINEYLKKVSLDPDEVLAIIDRIPPFYEKVTYE